MCLFLALRRIIEDRAAIIALKSRSATNEAELMKAKSRQLKITKILDQQDQEISMLTTKAKHELDQYHGNCKQYIRSFLLAFERAEMDKLPQHPFVPPLEDLDQAINRRKATLIEKVQADDRVKKLEIINSQDRVTKDDMKKNEQAFLRAIAISKHMFSDSSIAWRNRASKLLHDMPHHAKEFVKLNCTMEDQRPQIQAQEKTFRYPPPKNHDTPLQHKRILHARDLKQPCDQYFTSPEIPTVHLSSLRYAKSMVEGIQPTCSESPRKIEHAPHMVLAQNESQGNKRQKVEQQSVTPVSPVASHSRRNMINLSDVNRDISCRQFDVDLRADEKQIAKNGSADSEGINEEFSTAHILTNLHGDNKFGI